MGAPVLSPKMAPRGVVFVRLHVCTFSFSLMVEHPRGTMGIYMDADRSCQCFAMG